MNSKKDKHKEIHRHMIVKISKTKEKQKAKNLESTKIKMIDQLQGNSNKTTADFPAKIIEAKRE